MRLSFLIYTLFVATLAGAQTLPYNKFFDDSRVSSVFVTMDIGDETAMLDNPGAKIIYPASFVFFDGTSYDTLEQVGIRIKGNTSTGSAKKSFRLSFDEYDNGQKYHGVSKMNLIGSHNDPSMVREKLYYDIYNRFGLPPRRTSFVRLYLNDEYRGLYTNSEEIDVSFCKDRFGNNDGNLYKCTYPSDLVYINNNPNSYKYTSGSDRAYDLMTNKDQDDYTDLATFIKIIDQTPTAGLPCALEKVFDVDNFLREYALDISTGNWDDYGYLKNNFFIYKNQFTNRFEFIAYDTDNTFGVNFFGGVDWSTRNIYTWHNTSESRPLITKLLAIPAYHDQLSLYLKELANNILLPENIDPHIDSLKALITEAALEDTYRTLDYGYDDNDFLNSFDHNNIDGHTPYGLKNFIAARRLKTLQQITLGDMVPAVFEEHHFPLAPAASDNIFVSIRAYDDQTITGVKAYYSVDSVSFLSIDLFDDGLHNDGQASDHTWAGTIPPAGVDGRLYYYFEGTDNTSHVTRYPLCYAPAIRIGKLVTSLRINEFMASNTHTIADPSGAFADYVELFNSGPSSIYIGNFYLSDHFNNPSRWRLPRINMASGTWKLIWLDNDTEQGDDHADFKLDAGGEQLGLFATPIEGYAPMDTITFGPQSSDVSTGLLPNGQGPFIVLPFPSPGYSNDVLSTQNPGETEVWALYPNPSQEHSVFSLTLKQSEEVDIQVVNVFGGKAMDVFHSSLGVGTYEWLLTTQNLASGVYLIRYCFDGKTGVVKWVVGR